MKNLALLAACALGKIEILSPADGSTVPYTNGEAFAKMEISFTHGSLPDYMPEDLPYTFRIRKTSNEDIVHTFNQSGLGNAMVDTNAFGAQCEAGCFLDIYGVNPATYAAQTFTLAPTFLSDQNMELIFEPDSDIDVQTSDEYGVFLSNDAGFVRWLTTVTFEPKPHDEGKYLSTFKVENEEGLPFGGDCLDCTVLFAKRNENGTWGEMQRSGRVRVKAYPISSHVVPGISSHVVPGNGQGSSIHITIPEKRKESFKGKHFMIACTGGIFGYQKLSQDSTSILISVPSEFAKEDLGNCKVVIEGVDLERLPYVGQKMAIY